MGLEGKSGRPIAVVDFAVSMQSPIQGADESHKIRRRGLIRSPPLQRRIHSLSQGCLGVHLHSCTRVFVQTRPHSRSSGKSPGRLIFSLVATRIVAVVLGLVLGRVARECFAFVRSQWGRRRAARSERRRTLISCRNPRCSTTKTLGTPADLICLASSLLLGPCRLSSVCIHPGRPLARAQARLSNAFIYQTLSLFLSSLPRTPPLSLLHPHLFLMN